MPVSAVSQYTTFIKKLLPTPPPDPSQHDIILYDSHNASSRYKDTDPSNDFSSIGGAVGIAPNGMKVLWDLAQRNAAAVTISGYPVLHFISDECLRLRWSASPSRTPRNRLKELSCVAVKLYGTVFERAYQMRQSSRNVSKRCQPTGP